jgi:hypothetical protein
MSETPETQATCEEKGGTWNAETSTCKMPETEEKAITLGLTPRFERVMKDTMKLFEDRMEKSFNEMMETKLAALSIEAEQVLRKGLGLEHDPVVHYSELVSAIRKAALENTPPQTKTPLNTKEKGTPDGDPTTPKTFEEIVKAKLESLN